MAITFETKIATKREVAFGTTEITLTRPDNFDFVAGQYIQLNIPKLIYYDPKGSSRVFSIVSPPEEKDFLKIAFRNTESGYKKTLSEMEPGSQLDLEGPSGFFNLPKNSGNLQHVFIAGGIGITPFMSIIRSVNIRKVEESLTLVYANRNKESAAYINELENLSKSEKFLTLKSIFGKINPQQIDNFINDTTSALWWIVGPPNMVADMNNILISCGVDSSSIRHEEFTGY